MKTTGADRRQLFEQSIKKLDKRWFVLRDVHDESGLRLFQPRWAYSFMRGPMTRAEIQRAMAQRNGARGGVAR